MKIGVVLPHLLVFGGVRRYIEIGNEFVKRGHNFIIYTPEGIPPRWLGFNGEISDLRRLEESVHDVLITGSPEYLAYIDRGTARLRIFYLQIENVDNERDIIKSGKYHIMVNSSGLSKRIKRRYRVDAINGIGGINPVLFHPPAIGSSSVSIESSGGWGTMRVLCYGRLSRPRKGTRFVINAARWMYRRGYDVELHLFDASMGDSMDPRIGFDPGLPFRFYMNLPQERMAAMYQAAGVFVSAERRAGWSNTAAEAAACGLPLVCTDSGTTDFALNGESALVVPVRNSFFIRRALVKLYRDRRKALKLGVEARSRVLEFTWEKVCSRMELAFNRLLEENAGT